MAGIGGGLVSVGLGQQRQASDMLGNAADQEAERNIGNRQREQQRKAGNVQLGATAGAYYGSSLGPYGALIGGVVGAIGGGLF
jgi:hypothetical protein